MNIEDASTGLTINGLSIGEFNRVYGQTIEARKLLKIASGRKEVGLVGRLLVMAVGGSIGSAGGPMSMAAGLIAAQPFANVVAGTAARSLISQNLLNIAKLPTEEAQKVLTRIISTAINQQD